MADFPSGYARSRVVDFYDVDASRWPTEAELERAEQERAYWERMEAKYPPLTVARLIAELSRWPGDYKVITCLGDQETGCARSVEPDVSEVNAVFINPYLGDCDDV